MHELRPRFGVLRAQPGDPRSRQHSIPDLQDVFPAATRRVAEGLDIYRQGDSPSEIYALRRGWVFLYQIMEDGRRQILHFVFPGEVLNAQPGARHAALVGAQALTDVSLSSMSHDEFQRVVRSSPDIASQLAAQLERSWILAYEHMTNMGRRCARERLANLLLELFCRVHHRLPSTHGDAMALPLTQTIIADAIGLTAIHVNRTLRALRDEQILQLKLGTLHIFDPDRLIELAGLASELVPVLLGNHRAGRKPAFFSVGADVST